MTKKELKEIIKEDKKIYFSHGNHLKSFLWRRTANKLYLIGVFLITARKCQWAIDHKKYITGFILKRKKNKLGHLLNIELECKNIGRRIKIYHGNIVVNGFASIGDDCELYGNNCIGNKGTKYPLDSCPTIGDNVSIGYGVTIIGKVNIANNICISANSLVNTSFNEPYSLIGGLPAKVLRCNCEK